MAGVSDESVDSEALLAEADAKAEAERAMKNIVESERYNKMIPLLTFLIVLVLILSFVVGVFVFDKEGILMAQCNHLLWNLMSGVRTIGKMSREQVESLISMVTNQDSRGMNVVSELAADGVSNDL